MAFLRTVVRSFVLVGICAAWVQAQSTVERVNEAPQGRPRLVSVAPPPPSPQTNDYGPTVFTHLATTVLSDGRLAVDLGNAYELVADPCDYAYPYWCIGYGYPVWVYPTVFYAPVYVEPVYVAPVYAAPVYPTVVYPYPYYGYPVHSRVCYSCVYPSRGAARSVATPMGAVHAAPARAVPGRVLPVRSTRP
jgi:hypothetical protein